MRKRVTAYQNAAGGKTARVALSPVERIRLGSGERLSVVVHTGAISITVVIEDGNGKGESPNGREL